MDAAWLDSAVRKAAVTSIYGYQRYLSPRKGFACAYRVLHRTESCSEYAKQAIAQYGFFQAIPLIQKRFKACKAASQVFKTKISSNPAKGEQPSSSKDKPQNQPGNYCTASDACNGCIESLSCCEPAADATECGECNSFDCSGVDCGACDCSGVDCCSWG